MGMRGDQGTHPAILGLETDEIQGSVARWSETLQAAGTNDPPALSKRQCADGHRPNHRIDGQPGAACRRAADVGDQSIDLLGTRSEQTRHEPR